MSAAGFALTGQLASQQLVIFLSTPLQTLVFDAVRGLVTPTPTLRIDAAFVGRMNSRRFRICNE